MRRGDPGRSIAPYGSRDRRACRHRRRRVADRALRATAKLKVNLTDVAGNSKTEKLRVKLKAEASKPGTRTS